MVTLRANQIVSGLALTILAGAAGLSSYIGNDFNLADNPARHSFAPVNAFGLEDVPIAGPILFGQSWLVYASWVCVVVVGLYLSRTRPGLNVRAVGEAPAAADAMGISVTRYRYLHTVAGGAFAGVGGACFSLSLTPQWVDGLTGGAGLDRDRARHLRLLARRSLPRRGLRLRRLLGAAADPPGARRRRSRRSSSRHCRT